MVWWSTWTTHGLAPLVLTRIVTGPSLAFTCPERLDKSNKYKCGGCSREVRALKQFSIYNAPNMLLVHLKRFRPGFFGKVNKFIEFGTSLELQLCLSRGCVERQASPEYDLYAVVVHIDMYNISSFGHYVCYVRTESGDWFLTNDASVTNVPEEEVLKQNAYMLLYKRRVPRVWEVMTEAEVAEEAEHAASAAGTASASAAASGDDDMLPPRRSLSAALADPTSAGINQDTKSLPHTSKSQAGSSPAHRSYGLCCFSSLARQHHYRQQLMSRTASTRQRCQEEDQ
eukprot:m.222557 g.222557  ORF g.222557 m.222557 type:complete len:285 (+) comp18736_c0_seq7:113-967(+)